MFILGIVNEDIEFTRHLFGQVRKQREIKLACHYICERACLRLSLFISALNSLNRALIEP